jgi:hypothetical protein
MTVIRHAPRGIRASAEDCENAGLVAAAETLRNLADEVEVSRPALEGAVEECERLRVFERAFAKVPQERQARIMDAVRADTADGGQYVAKEDAAQSCWVVGGCYEENRLRLIEGRALGAHEQLTLVEASE